MTTTPAPRNTVLHGDCLQLMPGIRDSSVDFILTDPPYLVRYRSRDGRTVPNDDNDKWLHPAFAQMFRVMRWHTFAVSFYGWPSADKFIGAYKAAGFRIVGHFLFPKRYTSGSNFVRYQHECAHLLAKGWPRKPLEPMGDVVDWTYSGNKLHPTQKPLGVLMPLIENFCDTRGLVLDPFAGSGSTLMAAKRLGRDWLGIEIDPNYHAIATKRMAGGVA